MKGETYQTGHYRFSTPRQNVVSPSFSTTGYIPLCFLSLQSYIQLCTFSISRKNYKIISCIHIMICLVWMTSIQFTVFPSGRIISCFIRTFGISIKCSMFSFKLFIWSSHFWNPLFDLFYHLFLNGPLITHSFLQ